MLIMRKYIKTDTKLRQFLDTNDNKLHVVVEDNAGVVGVHFQFTRQNDEDQLAAICIVNASSTVVLQMGSLTPGLVLTALRTLFEDPSTVKVMHDIHRAAYWLHRYSLTNLRMVKCIDLQLVYENSVNPAHLQASMLEIVKNCESSGSSFTVAGTMASFQTKTQSVRPAEWTIKPLPESLLQRLTNEAQLYVWCYNAVDKELASSAACHAMTAARWQHAVANQGVRAIWFNPDADNQPRSLECFDYNNTGIPGMLALPGGISPLELQCDLDPVLELLPKEYSDAIVAIDDYHTKLVDVCLDVGRIPYVYTGKKQRVVLSKNYAPVTKETIDEIIANLGGEMRIGSDNRAGIDRQLHRISVMRDKTDEVYGLTMRVGRALLNSACVLTDLLLSDKHAGKSVLFLGKPGSGKTTLIRDVARCVSETMENVCIIDTSNEIGGDGLVPHSCVGWARRMMVPSLEAQASVMVECVQNHTVETLIVDEIGRKAEVLAASTVRQRGPRLIASAHGDFRSLIKNPDLKGLVGGSQLVILGDGAAARSGSKNKLQTQRAGNPIFDVIVELDHEVRGRCRIIWDAVREVDNVLEGSDYVYETRQRFECSCGVQMGSLTPGLVLTALRTLFEDPSTVKVMHDIHRAAYWLHRYSLTNLRMVKCIDLQLVYENSVNPAHLQASMLEIVKNCESSGSSFTVAGTMASFQTKTQSVRPAEWTIKPLPESLLQRLTNEAQLYVWCYNAVDKELASSAACHAMTAARWQHAVANQGVRAIWFNPDADNQPRSLECFDYNNTGIPGMLALPGGISPLELQCDLDPVLELLPKEYSDAIVAIDDYHTKLVDVCLDVGRIPYVYTGKKQRVVLSKNYAPVTKETIDEIIANLGGEMRIGSDNRAGIDRQLHRISVMRDKTDEVYGLTMRVGRALLNSACVLTDLLLSDKHAGKSVLFLGKPGSGKTTLIRDVARCVSETMENVCIIDTSNEIGGDGLVPHSCVGWARRMMVPSLEAQASVMVECVQNHTVETLIVDEIGRKAEVLAASTVRQRGPRLIASAHGDFRSLIKNPDLKGLVGGSQLVILGDGAAARSGSKNKLQTQRAGNPIFDVIVELDHEVRGRCRIIWDAVREVDKVLEANDYVYETRQWDASTCGVQIALNGKPLEYVKAPESVLAPDPSDDKKSLDVIVIVVKDQSGEKILFEMTPDTELEALFRSFAELKGLPVDSLRFLLDGMRVNGDEKPNTLELESSDIIDCALEQIGGHFAVDRLKRKRQLLSPLRPPNAQMNRSVRPENVEFTVKAAEDLVLTGKERSIVRVPANNMYSCLMQKTQRFSSLFRHYSKHHGLPRESLDFFFTNRLDPEDSPESVHLQKNDVILVRRRVAPTTMIIPNLSDEAYFATMRELFLSGAGSDITLEVGPDRDILRAHRLILTARCEIFEAMFRSGAMKESEDGMVRIEDHSPDMVSKMLEFIYTNRVVDLAKLNSNQLIDLLTLSEQYLLLPLKHLCEVAAQDVLSVGNVGRFLCAAEKFNASYLKEYCLAFFMDHSSDIIDDENFREEIESCPSMALTIVRATTRNAGSSSEPAQKRRRLNMPFDDQEYLSPST
ncbi:Uncharacterized protein P3T76_009666 [Phytophthora citrophthora]|uniref:AAA+ ATPase domain-containing protein n=1 Tax=Phytophthora citrophthora TaxID=4793 RepID=A0AAD9LJS3_9STRA|nr:Uncharacterized protein P3T76_009666 [Phytophthora citrophthora]